VPLTDREQQIVALLRADPLIGSSELARRLGTTRAAVNVHLSNLGKKGIIRGRGYILNDQPGVVVIGGANVDIKARSAAPLIPATSNPGFGSTTPGGVGRNIAENLARLGNRTFLVAAIGRDVTGENLMTHTADAGVRVEYVHRTDTATGTYVAVLDASGELACAVADMSATAEIGVAEIERARDIITTAELVVLDGNLAAAALEHALHLTAQSRVRTIVEPVSVAKAEWLAPQLNAEHPLFAITPNRDELATLTGMPTRTQRQVLSATRELHRRGTQNVWVRLGRAGSLLSDGTSVTTFPASDGDVVDVTGAGDAMLAAFCHALLDGRSLADAVRYGHAAAALTVASPYTVRPDLTPRLIEAALAEEHR
jgi:pseudouridine kinase